MADEKVIFKGALEALYLRALKEKVDAPFKEKLKAAGLDLSRTLEPAYPFETFRRFMRLTMTTLYGEKPTDAQQLEFGRLWTDGFFETFMGIALPGVLKLIGPRRAMLRSAQNYRNINNYAEARVSELAPNRFELALVDGEDWPLVSVGSLQRSVELTGARDVVTRHVRTDGAHNVYEVRWT